ncbi:TLC domain-containing protein 1 isoform X2 [Synchiropus splendidus]|uniref:TLC domain-containing protein 1 isoform X2 n=1 Tax=Synchiropus splendidus TaxID=270530 RepID=UPI00237D5F3B|nr:TLC domain-containing protein 1 isoform X2 [Synchiropus splendidus]
MMEALFPLLKSHPGLSVVLFFLVFRVLHVLLQNLPVPKVVRHDGFRSWKWKNISLSMLHSLLSATWSVTCLVVWPEMLSDIHYHTPISYLLVCVSTGDLDLPVHPLHSAVLGRCCHRPLSGGQQRDPSLPDVAEVGRRSELLDLLHPQIRQPGHLLHFPPQRTVLPHLVHRGELLLSGPWRVLPGFLDLDEHYDRDLLVPPAAHRLLFRDGEECYSPERDP